MVIAVWWESRLGALRLEEAEEMRFRSHIKCDYHAAFDK